MTSENVVEQFYDADPAMEWNRLERHRIEFAVTMRALRDWLPPAPANVLDIGGGPGRYSIELARLGYNVTLFDLSRANLRFAAEKAAEAGVSLAATVYGNALHLNAFANKQFDAVLLMGPLYHLFTEEDRLRAIGEALRVLKPAGMLFSACITRYAVLRDAAYRDPDWYVNKRDVAEETLKTGILRIPAGSGFTDHYSMHPLEMTPLIEHAGAVTHALVGVEGLVAGVESLINSYTGEAWDAWVDLNYRLGHDPSTHGGAYHLLHVGRKQGRFASAIVRRGDNILLQQARGPNDPAPSWYIPGGSVEAHETFEQAVVREVREETGIEALAVGDVIYTTHMRNPKTGGRAVARIFEVTEWRGDIAIDDPDGLTLQARFVPLAEAIELVETTVPWPHMREPLLAYLRGQNAAMWRYRTNDDDTYTQEPA